MLEVSTLLTIMLAPLQANRECILEELALVAEGMF